MRRSIRALVAAAAFGGVCQLGGCFYEVALRNQPFVEIPVTVLTPPSTPEGTTQGLSAITIQQDSITIANPLRIGFGFRGR